MKSYRERGEVHALSEQAELPILILMCFASS